jgi:hypothetical protein
MVISLSIYTNSIINGDLPQSIYTYSIINGDLPQSM